MTTEWDVELKRAAKGTRTEVPDVVRYRIDDTLAALPVKLRMRKTRKMVVMSAVVAASVACIVGAGVMSPDLAQALRQSPILGSVFDILGDDGLKKAQMTGMVTEIDQSVTDEGITVKITEALYDGARISIGYVLESSGELAEDQAPHLDFKINGERLGNYGAGGHGDFVDAHTYVGLLHIDPSEALPETFDLEMTVRQLGVTKGTWKFAFPVSTNTSGNQTVMPMEIKTFGDTSLIVERVTFAVSSTMVVGQVKGLSKEPGPVRFEVVDEKGTKLQEMAWSGQRDAFKAQFSPVQVIPKAITIRPIQINQTDLSADLVKGLEMTIPIQ